MDVHSKITSGLLEKVFGVKDVFFNNGVVNLLEHLENNNIKNLEYRFNNSQLTLLFDKSSEKTIYNQLLIDLIEQNNIVHLTPNDRIYWNMERDMFAIDKKFDVEGKASANDVKYLYNYISAKQLNISTSEFYEKFKTYAATINMMERDKVFIEAKKCFMDSGDSFKEESKAKIPIHMTKQKAVKNFAAYFAKGELLTFDSKIHQFEDGGYCFRDRLMNKANCIDKWDALIYWYGSRIKRFYNASYYFIYFNSNDLKALKTFKACFKISNDKIEQRMKDTDKAIKLPTNIDFKDLSRDGITNRNFYISNSQQEFQLKFFMFLFSKIYHIEDDYKNKIKDVRKKRRKEALFNSLRHITFVTYTEDGPLKSGLSEYTKAYVLMQLFNRLITYESSEKEIYLFKYLAELIVKISIAKPSKTENVNIKRFTDNLLNFRILRKNYFEAAYDSLKNDKGGLGKELFTFENVYLEFIGKGRKEMDMHKLSKKAGDEIGYFSAKIDDKNLLFKLRNVKNHGQLIAYFKDFKFIVLKYQEEARFTKEFIEDLQTILEELNECNEDWELVRDYIAIYAIDKYRSVNYAQNKKGGR